MIRRSNLIIALHVIVVVAGTAGCDERVVEVAREAANRQAAQNKQMGELQKEVAIGTRALVDADAAARKEIVGVHRDLQAERRQLATGWNNLESQRQQIAKERRTDSIAVYIAIAVGGITIVTVLIGLFLQLMKGARRSALIDGEICATLLKQVLTSEISAAESKLANRLIVSNSEPSQVLDTRKEC